MKKHLLILFLIFFSFKAIAGDSPKQRVDSLLAKAMEFGSQGKLVPYIETAIKAFNLANSANYDEGKAKSGMYIAEGLVTVGLFKEALKQLDRIETTDIYKKKSLYNPTFIAYGDGLMVVSCYISRPFGSFVCSRNSLNSLPAKSKSKHTSIITRI